jgi:hypothetical protein
MITNERLNELTRLITDGFIKKIEDGTWILEVSKGYLHEDYFDIDGQRYLVYLGVLVKSMRGNDKSILNEEDKAKIIKDARDLCDFNCNQDDDLVLETWLDESGNKLINADSYQYGFRDDFFFKLLFRIVDVRICEKIKERSHVWSVD